MLIYIKMWFFYHHYVVGIKYYYYYFKMTHILIVEVEMLLGKGIIVAQGAKSVRGDRHCIAKLQRTHEGNKHDKDTGTLVMDAKHSSGTAMVGLLPFFTENAGLDGKQ